MLNGKLMARRFGETKPHNTVLGVSSFRDKGLPDYVNKAVRAWRHHTHSLSSGRCFTEMNEAISHCVQVTDLPELVTSVRDPEITHVPSSLPHSALSSPTWINEGLCQLLLADEKKGKTERERQNTKNDTVLSN